MGRAGIRSKIEMKYKKVLERNDRIFDYNLK